MALSSALIPCSAITVFILLIEFVDELVDCFVALSLPYIRTEFALTYAEVGFLLASPKILGTILEAFVGIFSERGYRIQIALVGGVLFTSSLLLISTASSYAGLLIGFLLFNPASGAFVGLAQATLMDLYPRQREAMMARWTLSGASAHLVGPIVFTVLLGSGADWRAGYVIAALLSASIWLSGIQQVGLVVGKGNQGEGIKGFWRDLSGALSELRQIAVIKWVVALEVADLMLDIFTSFIALYLVETLHFSLSQAAFVVLVRSLGAFLGEAFIAIILGKVQGVSYLKVSSGVSLIIYFAFMNVTEIRLICLTVALLSFATAGWYSVLKANLYAAVPHRSGLIVTLNAISGMAAGILPYALGCLADTFGLRLALSCLLVAPVFTFLVARSVRADKAYQDL